MFGNIEYKKIGKELHKAANYLKQGLNFVDDYSKLVPKKNDTTIGKYVKCVSIVNKVIDLTNKSDIHHNYDYAESIDFLWRFSKEFAFLFRDSIENDFKMKIFEVQFSDNKQTMREYNHPDLGKLIFQCNKYSDGRTELNGWCFFDKKFNHDKLFDAIWAKFNNKIDVFIDESTIGDSNRAEHVKFLKIEDSTNVLFGKSSKTCEEFCKQFLKYKDDNISRTYLFYGPPGTGKSTFATKLSDSNLKIIRIDQASLATISIVSFKFLINKINANLIIIDDIDRILNDTTTNLSLKLLNMLSNIRENTNIGIILTANDITKLNSALLRPGRIDEMIEFLPPDREDRKILLEEYIKHFNIDQVENIDALVEKTENLTGAYLKEIALQLRYKSIDDVIAIIEQMKLIKAKIY